MKWFPVIFCLLLLGETGPGVAQQSSGAEVLSSLSPVQQDAWGIPFPSKHYSPSDYDQHPQNWAVVQDERGLTYVANSDGVLQYDGERWRTLVQARTSARSLAADSLVYVGLEGDFGYLHPDTSGRLRYRSLYDHIPEEQRNFGDVWKTHLVNGVTYYQTHKYLFRWDGTTVKTWSSDEQFHTSFALNDTLYVRERERGLLRMTGDSLTLVEGGAAFSDRSVHVMAPHPSGDVLVGTEENGLYLYGDGDLQPFAPELTPYLRKHSLYHGARVPGNRYVLATLGGGALVVNAQGELLRVLNASTGLPDEVINYVYVGRENEVWMALHNDGLYRADLNSPTTLYDQRTGLQGIIRHIHSHRGTTYVATGRGLHVRSRTEQSSLGDRPVFFKYQNDVPLAWELLSTDNVLLAATQQGVYRIDGNDSHQITDTHSFTFSEAPDDRVVYVGTRTGLTVLKQRPGGWMPTIVKGIDTEVQAVNAGPNGTLWLGTKEDDLLCVKLSPDGRRIARRFHFDEAAGLPAGYKGPLFVNDEITILSKRGMYQIRNPDQPPDAWRFELRPSLLPDVDRTDSLAVKNFVVRKDETLWTTLGNQVFHGRPTNEDGYAWKSIPSLHFPKPAGVKISVERDGSVWLGRGKEALIHYDPRRSVPTERPAPSFRALVREVRTLQSGSVAYGGAASGLGPDSTLTLPYSRNDFRVAVAAPLYSRTTTPRYQYKLAGHSNEWSEWSDQTDVTYTNVWEGTYHFRVRARDERGRVSQPGTLTIHIQPPWYRSVWAYVCYVGGLMLLGLGLRHYYRISQERKQAREQAQKLEKEREAIEKLERANRRLREANRLKENFLANTSHELRTPLTNILGFVDVLRDTSSEEQERFLNAIKRNSQRLEQTPNALLKLSRLRAEEREPDLGHTPVGKCAQRVVADFEEDARKKGLALRVNTPPETIYAEANEQYVEQILRNLVENAIKFTEEGTCASPLCRRGNRSRSRWKTPASALTTNFCRGSSRTSNRSLGAGRVRSKGTGSDSRFRPGWPRS